MRRVIRSVPASRLKLRPRHDILNGSASSSSAGFSAGTRCEASSSQFRFRRRSTFFRSLTRPKGPLLDAMGT